MVRARIAWPANPSRKPSHCPPVSRKLITRELESFDEAVTTTFRIVGTNLPGENVSEAAMGVGAARNNVCIGIQCGKVVLNIVPGDATEARFEFDAEVTEGDIRGPCIHGKKGDRFVYLSWGENGADGFEMFRRIKLHVSHIGPAARTVEARLELTDGRGGPVCGTVRPPRVQWRVQPE